MSTPDSDAVEHDVQARQFFLLTAGLRSVLDYRIEGDVLIATHTGVPVALRGRGIAERLTRAMLAWCAAQGFALRPQCSYTARFVERHPPGDVRLV